MIRERVKWICPVLPRSERHHHTKAPSGDSDCEISRAAKIAEKGDAISLEPSFDCKGSPLASTLPGPSIHEPTMSTFASSAPACLLPVDSSEKNRGCVCGVGSRVSNWGARVVLLWKVRVEDRSLHFCGSSHLRHVCVHLCLSTQSTPPVLKTPLTAFKVMCFSCTSSCSSNWTTPDATLDVALETSQENGRQKNKESAKRRFEERHRKSSIHGCLPPHRRTTTWHFPSVAPPMHLGFVTGLALVVAPLVNCISSCPSEMAPKIKLTYFDIEGAYRTWRTEGGCLQWRGSSFEIGGSHRSSAH
jgi:hypothetical protein